MDWNIAAVISALGGGGAFLSWYNAKANRDSIAIKNMKEVIDEIKAHHTETVESFEKKFERLEKKVSALDLKNEVHKNIIHQGYACRFAPEGDQCPVAKANDELCYRLKDELDKVNK